MHGLWPYQVSGYSDEYNWRTQGELKVFQPKKIKRLGLAPLATVNLVSAPRVQK